MAKHLTKAELLAQIKHTANVSRKSASAPFTGMAILCNYVLWKTEGYGQKRLADFNQMVNDYYERDMEDELDVKELADRLMEKAEFVVEWEPHKESDNHYSKHKKYRHFMEQKLLDAEDEINRCSTKYLLIQFNVLMDCGWGKVRLTRYKDALNKQLWQVKDPNGDGALRMRAELMNGTGIIIEMPK